MAGVYQGYSSPIQKRQLGFFTPFTGIDTIRASIVHILGTRIGERVHLYDFGSRMAELVFEPNDSIFVAMARSYVDEALARWEPRISVVSTDVVLDPTNNAASIRITYKIRGPVPATDTLSLQFNRDTGITV